MKTINLLITSVMLISATAMPVLAQNDTKEQLVVSISDPGKPGSLEVGLINGFIHVVGYSGKDVVIDAVAGPTRRNEGTRKAKGQPNDGLNERLNENLNENLNSRRKDDPGVSAGMKRISAGNPFDLSAEEKNNRVKVSTSSIHNPVDLTIKVPRRFSLKLHTVNNGDITVENVTGELEINNVNGGIELTNIGGSAVANTINGDLKATFKEVTNTPMAFSTLNGRVDVTFPASVKANVKLKSDRGDIFSDFDIDVDKSQPKATRTSQSGMYRVTVDDWVYGKINNGGSEVMMKTMQGNIYVRKAK